MYNTGVAFAARMSTRIKCKFIDRNTYFTIADILLTP